MACSLKWKNGDGEPQEKTTWFRVTAWRREAELASQYLSKGKKVLVIGEIEEPRPWTDREGNTRASLELTAHTIRFLSGREEGEATAVAAPVRSSNGAGLPTSVTPKQAANAAPVADDPWGKDDDIPF